MLVKKIDSTIKVKVIDSVMGSGKTSWAIQFMDSEPLSKKFIFVTPFLDEIERVMKNSNREFMQPESSKNKTKLDDLKELISDGYDIVTTHALFQNFNQSVIDLLDMLGYSLILDETINAIECFGITKSDLKILLNSKDSNGTSVISVDKKNFINWNVKDYEHGVFKSLLNASEAGKLVLYNNSQIFKVIPIEIFECFTEVFVLTYLFEGQLQKYYFDMFKVEYSLYSVKSKNETYYLDDYIPLSKQDLSLLKSLIKIFYSKPSDKNDLNIFGYKKNALSKAELNKLIKVKEKRNIIKNFTVNFYRHKAKVKTEEVMWTTFKDYQKILQPEGLKDKFVAVNARATNNFSHKSTCIYLANRYMNPVTKRFIESQGITVREDLYALAELLQWLFRSRVRKGEPIEVYIPAFRMRRLLEEYLSNKFI